jgi:hypothetical protein
MKVTWPSNGFGDIPNMVIFYTMKNIMPVQKDDEVIFELGPTRYTKMGSESGPKKLVIYLLRLME